jgi:hypothetical protein
MLFRKFPEFFKICFSRAAFGIMIPEIPFFFEFRFPVLITSRTNPKSFIGLRERMPGIFILYLQQSKFFIMRHNGLLYLIY